MHGVRREKFTTTTEDQKEAKKKERFKKLEAFKKGSQLVLRKNKTGVFDDEGLAVSAKLLCGNPDVYTFWNYRRRVLQARRTLKIVFPTEISETEVKIFLSGNNCGDDLIFDEIIEKIELLSEPKCGDLDSNFDAKILFKNEEIAKKLKKDGEGLSTFEDRNFEEKKESEKKWTVSLGATGSETLETLYQNELSLTEGALEKNPKSYSAWYQRGWVLKRMESPDYQKEIKMCNMALKMDERNFHCWDHRRLVCQLAEILPEAELEFTSEKVRENFSNYSAWHYRSSLLPILKPPKVPGLPLETEALIMELDLAKNAFYTDPEDQSAWFYSCWLTESQLPNEVTTLPSELREALISQLADCQELSKEEPMNKWPVLIASLCMRRLNSENQYDGQIFENLEKLEEMDSMRRNFYADLKTTFGKELGKT